MERIRIRSTSVVDPDTEDPDLLAFWIRIRNSAVSNSAITDPGPIWFRILTIYQRLKIIETKHIFTISKDADPKEVIAPEHFLAQI